MVEVKNATLSITQTTQPASGGLLENPQSGAPVTCQVYFEETTPAEMWKEFGVELVRPAFIQCDPCDFAKFGLNAKCVVTIFGQKAPRGTFYVHGAEQHVLGDECDHGDIYVSGLQYTVIT